MSESRKNGRYESHAREIEAVVDGIKAIEQINQERSREDENRLKTARAKLAEKLYIHLANEKHAMARDASDTMDELIDSCVLMDVMDKCLRAYKKIEGRWFLSYFIKSYNNSTINEALREQSCSVDSAVEGEAVRQALRRVAKERGMTAEEINKKLHKPSGDYINPKAYSKYFNDDFIRKFLMSLPRPYDDEEAKKFIDAVHYASYTANVDDEANQVDENGYEDGVTSLDKQNKRDYDEAENESAGLDIFDEAYRIAASGKKKDAMYLRCLLTLNAMKADTISTSLERHIDMDFVKRHGRDDYSASYEAAKKEAAAQGKKIQEKAFFAKMRLSVMADEMGLARDTLESYCKRAKARTLDVAMKNMKRFELK